MRYLARIAVFVYSCTFAALTCTTLALAADPATSTDRRPLDVRLDGVVRGGLADPAKAAGDTARLIGPAALSPLLVGTFEDGAGQPHWQGWTSVDWTAADTTDTAWHVSGYFAINGAYSAYCGDETIPSCGGGDPVGGYRNGWDSVLAWRATVANPGISTTIHVHATIDVDSEPLYDYASVGRLLPTGAVETLWAVAGDSTASVHLIATYEPGEYMGDDSDEVVVVFRAESDEVYSDEDCDFSGAGFMRVDDVTITCDNPSLVVAHDFEDGTFGPFARYFLPGVGDFAQIRANMGDADICIDNLSPQVVFIDDGIIQPLTGGSPATDPDRMYADGWVVNYTGGVTFDPDRHLDNSVLTPVIPWPEAGHDGARFGITCYLDNLPYWDDTGIYLDWKIRSTDGDAASIEDATWIHPPFVMSGGPGYYRRFWDVTDMLVPGRTFVQLSIGPREVGYQWGINGSNGSPAPYIDNVRLESFPHPGPSLSTQVRYLASDAFPANGELDTADLGRNGIRFDMAQNISPPDHERLQHGDSVVVDAMAMRIGAALTERPRLHYTLRRNPDFDPYRTAGWPDSGVVVMDTTFTQAGATVADRYNVDLPDEGFLFPGDVLHFRFSVESALGGPGGADPLTVNLPADLTWYGDFNPVSRWSNTFTVRGLPSDLQNAQSSIPRFLFWDDSDWDRSLEDHAWIWAFNHYLDRAGIHCDVFFTKSGGADAGTGLGARATAAQLAAYRDILYSSGFKDAATLSNGDWSNGGGDDIGLLTTWLEQGDHDLFLAGNSLAFDLHHNGGGDFLAYKMGVSFVSRTHRDLLGGQLAPRIVATPWVFNPVFNTRDEWIADGGCPSLWDFDLVTIMAGAERLAEFAGPYGQTGYYPYSAATLMTHGDGSRVVSMTHDPAMIWRAYGVDPVPQDVIGDVMDYFTISKPWSAVPDAGVFSALSRPNPFNPVTEIVYTIKAPGHLTLKIFNLRGEVVRTLVDDRVEQGGRIPWDGTDSHGGQVSSGVYFYEARMGGDVQVGKMALVK